MPLALHRESRLAALVTDAWADPAGIGGRLLGSCLPRLRERHVEGLPREKIHSQTLGLLGFEAGWRIRGGVGDWERMTARNAWFQQRAIDALERLLRRLPDSQTPVVFCYSYAARRILKRARALGCRTVLGQIDPGPVEERLVAAAVGQHPELAPRWSPVPDGYWAEWHEECALADRIVVNSEWSRAALAQEGVPVEKLAVIPLMYTPPPGGRPDRSRLPDVFTRDRPLRVLFLGALIIRKGIAVALEAARLLADEAVEFSFVGPEGVSLPLSLKQRPGLRWLGPVRRGETARHYAAADVFIFPTLSDGFGLTQLEAMGAGLPVVASRHCGDVVRHGADGLLLDALDGPTLAAALRELMRSPARLTAMSAAAHRRVEDFAPARLAPSWLALAA